MSNSFKVNFYYIKLAVYLAVKEGGQTGETMELRRLAI
jgi:hypothetical protein